MNTPLELIVSRTTCADCEMCLLQRWAGIRRREARKPSERSEGRRL